MDEVSLGSAIEQLYSGDPADFVATRRRLVAQARKLGDKDLAKTVGGLRKPSVTAGAVNLLARRENPPDIPALRELGARMREATQRMDAAQLKTLGAERTDLIGRLVDQAAEYGASTGPAREQLVQTFTAALASPEAEDAVCSGHLVNPLSYSGFGEVEVDEAVALPLRELQEARLAELAEREAERAARPTRAAGTGDDPEPVPEPAAEPDTEPSTEPEPPEPAKPEPAPARPAASSTPSATATDEAAARAVYDQCVALEQQAQAAVEAARTALATAKEHAAAAARARQAAEDLLDSLA